jgi:hypothetical protein
MQLNKPPPQLSWTTLYCLVIALLALGTGCAGYRESYSIRNLTTGEQVSLKTKTPYPQRIIETDNQRIRIFTGTRDARFEITDIGYDGKVIRTIPVGRLSTYYLRAYAWDMIGLAVSPDATRIAYCDIPSRELRLFNINDESHTVLRTNIPSDWASIEFLKWRSDDELIVGFDESETSAAQLFMINISTKALVFELGLHGLMGNKFALSHNKRYMAYWDALSSKSIYGDFHIYDLSVPRELGITPSSHKLFSSPYWTEADESLCYGEQNKLMLYSLARKEAICLRSYADGLAVHVKGTGGTKVFFKVVPSAGKGGRKALKGLYIFDLASKTERILKDVPLHEKVIVSPDGKFLITGSGL